MGIIPIGCGEGYFIGVLGIVFGVVISLLIRLDSALGETGQVLLTKSVIGMFFLKNLEVLILAPLSKACVLIEILSFSFGKRSLCFLPSVYGVHPLAYFKCDSFVFGELPLAESRGFSASSSAFGFYVLPSLVL